MTYLLNNHTGTKAIVADDAVKIHTGRHVLCAALTEAAGATGTILINYRPTTSDEWQVIHTFTGVGVQTVELPSGYIVASVSVASTNASVLLAS